MLLRLAQSSTWSRLILPTPKYLVLGCAKYSPLTELAGHIAQLSVRRMPVRFSASSNSHSRRFFLARFLLQQIDEERRAATLLSLPGGDRTVSAYVLLSAARLSDGCVPCPDLDRA